jgi:hypothetical protein
MQNIKISERIEREDVIRLDKNMFLDCCVLDLSEVDYFHVSFAGFLADVNRKKHLKIIFPKNKMLRRLIEWIK